MQQDGDFILLTAKGRLLSNEVFERFLFPEEVLAIEPLATVKIAHPSGR
jgi:hypothetical protein